MEITIYTLPTCTSCVLLKSLLKRANVSVKEYVVNEDITMEEYNKKYPHIQVVPLIIFEDILYISIKDIAKKLIEKGLIELPNK